MFSDFEMLTGINMWDIGPQKKSNQINKARTIE